MLALYTGKGIAPEVNLRECIPPMPPQSWNKVEPTLALKPRGDFTRNPKQGYQWPHKRLKKKQTKNKQYLLDFIAPFLIPAAFIRNHEFGGL